MLQDHISIFYHNVEHIHNKPLMLLNVQVSAKKKKKLVKPIIMEIMRMKQIVRKREREPEKPLS